jgi:hypothetical protein
LESELQRIARRLVECLDELPKVAGDLREQANWCREKAALVGQLARGDPKGSQIAALLDGAARRCEEAAETCLKAHQPGRDWAMEQVGDAGASAGAASAKGEQRLDRPNAESVDSDRPTGQQLAEGSTNVSSRLERARVVLHERADDVLDIADRWADTVDGVFGPPSPAYSETRSAPVVTETPREGVDPGHAASAVVVVAIVIGELIRWLRRALTRSEGGNRAS